MLKLIGSGPEHSGIAVSDADLAIKMGRSFDGRAPRTSVTSARALTDTVISRGVHGWRGDWLVNGAGAGLVELRFEPPMPGHVLLFPVQGATAADRRRRSRRARRRGGRWHAVPDGADTERTRTYSWDDPLELLSRDCRHVRARGSPPDRRGRAAAAADRE